MSRSNDTDPRLLLRGKHESRCHWRSLNSSSEYESWNVGDLCVSPSHDNSPSNKGLIQWILWTTARWLQDLNEHMRSSNHKISPHFAVLKMENHRNCISFSKNLNPDYTVRISTTNYSDFSTPNVIWLHCCLICGGGSRSSVSDKYVKICWGLDKWLRFQFHPKIW